MKDYLMTFDENGKPKFVDKQDKASFEKLLSFLKHSGHKNFLMTISEVKSMSTEKQGILWKVIKDLIHAETGNDLKTIEETLNVSGKDVSQMNKEEFKNLLENAFSICNEFFNVNISLNRYGNYEIKK